MKVICTLWQSELGIRVSSTTSRNLTRFVYDLKGEEYGAGKQVLVPIGNRIRDYR